MSRPSPSSSVQTSPSRDDAGDDLDDISSVKSAGLDLLRFRPSSSNGSAAPSVASSDSEPEIESEADAVTRPVGKMVARMLQVNAAAAPTESAYERAKRELMKKQEDEAAPTRPDTAQSHGAASSDSENDLPITKRVVQRQRRSRGSTSSPTPSARSRKSPSSGVSRRSTSPALAGAYDEASDSDSDLPINPLANSRLQELVARKRVERKVREQEEEAQERGKLHSDAPLQEIVSAEGNSEGENEAGRRLTQQARPTRKASKKALEEMSRETQRMERNMQLTHQARTKKRYTTKDLFAKFNYKLPKVEEMPSHNLSSSPARSETGTAKMAETPPTSPPSADDLLLKVAPTATVTQADDGYDIGKAYFEEKMSGTQPFINSDPLPLAPRSLVKGKAKEGAAKVTAHIASNPPPVIVRRAKPLDHLKELSSDDDLEIVKPSTRFPVFDRIPTKQLKESRSLCHLRALAHLTSPGKTNNAKDPQSMAPSEMQTLLQRRARQQAKQERQEKLDELRAKGIIIQTEEEKLKEQLEFENLLENARADAMEIAKKEKEQAKRNGKEDGEEDGLLESEDDDEDYQGSADEEIELSGSEDGGEDGEDEEEDEGNEEEDAGVLLDDQAAEESGSDEDQADDEHDDEASDGEDVAAVRRKPLSRPSRVIVEEDEDEEEICGQLAGQPAPMEDEEDLAAAFGVKPMASEGLGLTQMFAGTMADVPSQTQVDSQGPPREEDSLDFLRNLPLATAPEYQPEDNSFQTLVEDSQSQSAETQSAQQSIRLNPSQFTPNPNRSVFDTQHSQIPDPTQDGGLEESDEETGVPLSTADTVLLPIPESPVMQRKGRLRRRSEAVPEFSDVDEEGNGAATPPDEDDEEFEISANAFDVLRKAATKPRQPIEVFNKKKSEAKNMVQEQAEESEDEYAGIGGASDDESGDEVDEEVAKMIDEGEVNVDERKIAAFYADKERAEDEKGIDKLYKDITNGVLRRKRGADYELSDSDDDAAERRRRKQREFARMRKALLEDEKLGKIAENPKKMAFLRAIEDRDSDVEADIFSEPEESPDSIPDSQEPTTDATVKATATAKVEMVNPLKRKAQSSNDENRPPAHLRRTAPTGNAPIRRPATLAEIRDSVSFLLEDPHTIPDSQLSGASDDDDSGDEHSAGAWRPPPLRKESSSVIDRLSLLSRSSTDLSNPPTAAAAAKQAFHASTGGFKVPALVRRTTAHLASTTTSSAGTTTTTTTSASTLSVVARSAAAPADGGRGVRMGGSKKSNIHYQAREVERRRVLERAEEKRKEGVRRKVAGARAGGGLRGVLGRASGWE